jgi:hypothetical protein
MPRREKVPRRPADLDSSGHLQRKISIFVGRRLGTIAVAEGLCLVGHMGFLIL